MRVLAVVIPPVGMTIALLGLAAAVDLSAVVRAMTGVHPGWIAIALILCLLNTLIASLRLRFFLAAAGTSRSLRRCWSAVMAGLTLNAFLPSRAGDLVKGVFLADGPDQRRTLLGVVLVERVFDVLILGALACTAAILMAWHSAALMAGVLTALPIGAFLLLRYAHRLPAFRETFERLGRGARAVTSRPGPLFTAIGFAAWLWLNNTIVIWCLLNATGSSVRPGIVAAAVPLAIFIGLLPVSISGIGTRDAALAALLHGVAEPEAVVAAAMLYTVLGYWMLAAIGALTLRAELARALLARRERV